MSIESYRLFKEPVIKLVSGVVLASSFLSLIPDIAWAENSVVRRTFSQCGETTGLEYGTTRGIVYEIDELYFPDRGKIGFSDPRPKDPDLKCYEFELANYIDPNFEGALAILESLPSSSEVLQALKTPGWHILYAEGNKNAITMAPLKKVFFNPRLKTLGDTTKAALLAHESSHIMFSKENGDPQTLEAHYQDELKAYTLQLQIWEKIYGSSGNPDPLDEFALDMNYLLRCSSKQRADIIRQISEESWVGLPQAGN